MATLTVTAKGQLTLKKELLQHLGIKAGDKVEFLALPNARASLRAAPKMGDIRELSGMLAGITDKVATLDELDEAARAGWAGRVR